MHIGWIGGRTGGIGAGPGFDLPARGATLIDAPGARVPVPGSSDPAGPATRRTGPEEAAIPR